MAQAALIGASALYTANAQKKAGAAQRDLANRNGMMQDAQAADAIQRGEEESLLIKRRARRLRGQQRVGYAAQGVDIGSGTAADVQEETTAMGDLDAAQVKRNAFREAWGLSVGADNSRLAGRYAYKAGRNQAIGTVLGGVGEAARGYYSYDAPRVAGGRG